MEPLDSAPASAEAAPIFQEQKPVALEALEQAEKTLEERASKGISGKELLDELTRLAGQSVTVKNTENNQWSELVQTEDEASRQQAQDSAIEAGRVMDEGRKQLEAEAQASLNTEGEAATESPDDHAEDQSEALKKALTETDAIVKDFESRAALDAVGQSYLEAMRAYRNLLDAQLRNAASEIPALTTDYEQKLNGYQKIASS